MRVDILQVRSQGHGVATTTRSASAPSPSAMKAGDEGAKGSRSWLPEGSVADNEAGDCR